VTVLASSVTDSAPQNDAILPTALPKRRPKDYDGAGYSSPFALLAAQGWYSIRISDADDSCHFSAKAGLIYSRATKG
jgi:hypothetical protein